MMITTSETSALFDTMSCQLPGGIEPYVPVAAEIDIPFDGRLVDLATKIRQDTRRLEHAMRTAVGRMRSIGGTLVDAKCMCGQHGRWLKFLQYCGIADRYAQECMKIARHWTEIEANTSNCSHLTLTDVRRILRSPPTKALELNTEERASNAVVRAKRKSAVLTNRSESRCDHQAHLEIEQPPVPEPAPFGPADQQQDTQGASAASVQNTDDDASWLNSLPIRVHLDNPVRFDEAAALWKSVKLLVDQLRETLSPSATQIAHGAIANFAMNNYRIRLIFAAFVKPPSEWRLCSKCMGRFSDRVGSIPCPLCDGGGFVVTHEGDFEEADS